MLLIEVPADSSLASALRGVLADLCQCEGCAGKRAAAKTAATPPGDAPFGPVPSTSPGGCGAPGCPVCAAPKASMPDAPPSREPSGWEKSQAAKATAAPPAPNPEGEAYDAWQKARAVARQHHQAADLAACRHGDMVVEAIKARDAFGAAVFEGAASAENVRLRSAETEGGPVRLKVTRYRKAGGHASNPPAYAYSVVEVEGVPAAAC